MHGRRVEVRLPQRVLRQPIFDGSEYLGESHGVVQHNGPRYMWGPNLQLIPDPLIGVLRVDVEQIHGTAPPLPELHRVSLNSLNVHVLGPQTAVLDIYRDELTAGRLVAGDLPCADPRFRPQLHDDLGLQMLDHPLE